MDPSVADTAENQQLIPTATPYAEPETPRMNTFGSALVVRCPRPTPSRLKANFWVVASIAVLILCVALVAVSRHAKNACLRLAQIYGVP
jgi:hypothetical protein